MPLHSASNRIDVYLKLKDLVGALCNYFDDSHIKTVRDALSIVRVDWRSLEGVDRKYKSIQENLEVLGDKGLTKVRLLELMAELEIKKLSKLTIRNKKGVLLEEQSELNKQEHTKRPLLAQKEKSLEALGIKNGLVKDVVAGRLYETLSQRLENVEEKFEVMNSLREKITIRINEPTSSLSKEISKAQDISSRWASALVREEEGFIRLNVLESRIAKAEEGVSFDRSALERLKRAKGVISELLSGDDSPEKLSQLLLEENSEVISEIFSKIHQPNEYDLIIDKEGIKLSSKLVENDTRTLREVSTGQRAAFALSLFLAMNKILGDGPKIILLDDPISHIDDINMLSFLDYLRDIAVDGRRQLFFATPNKKLAGLFRHKFGFLGKDIFKEIELKRT